MLNEKDFRNSEYRGGHPVMLADGSTWFVPVPRLLFAADESEAGCSLATNLGSEFDAQLNRMEEAAGLERVHAEFRLFKTLLALNYAIPSQELNALLRLDYSALPGEEFNRVRLDLLAIVRGEIPSPKAQGAGSL